MVKIDNYLVVFDLLVVHITKLGVHLAAELGEVSCRSERVQLGDVELLLEFDGRISDLAQEDVVEHGTDESE